MASRLERRLGVAETTSVAIGAMIGAGVYVSMGEAAGTTGGSLLVAVLIGAAVALLNGLSSAELAVDDPRAGGAYQFASRLISPTVGFAAGWLFLFAGLTAGATFSLTFAAYLGPLFPSLPPRVLGIALTVGAGLLNVLGVRPSIRANILLVLINGGGTPRLHRIDAAALRRAEAAAVPHGRNARPGPGLCAALLCLHGVRTARDDR